MEEIGATASFNMEVGDVLTILTPGGGGFGAEGGDVGAGGQTSGAAAGIGGIGVTGCGIDVPRSGST